MTSRDVKDIKKDIWNFFSNFLSIERDGNNISTPKSNIRSVSAITVVTDGRTEVFTKLSVEFASQKKKKCIVPTLYLLYNVCFVNTYVYIYIYIYRCCMVTNHFVVDSYV